MLLLYSLHGSTREQAQSLRARRWRAAPARDRLRTRAASAPPRRGGRYVEGGVVPPAGAGCSVGSLAGSVVEFGARSIADLAASLFISPAPVQLHQKWPNAFTCRRQSHSCSSMLPSSSLTLKALNTTHGSVGHSGHSGAAPRFSSSVLGGFMCESGHSSRT